MSRFIFISQGEGTHQLTLNTTITLTDIATIILAIATTVSLIYIGRQVRVTRQQTKGEFLLALDAQIEKSRPIIVRVLNEQAFKPVGEDWPQIWAMMSIFERMNIMLDDRILDIRIIDRLYAFVLRAIIAHDDIYERLQATGAEWQDFIELCYAVADYRERKGAGAQDRAFIERVRKLSKEARDLKNPWRF
jgi:hypothetical protein